MMLLQHALSGKFCRVIQSLIFADRPAERDMS